MVKFIVKAGGFTNVIVLQSVKVPLVAQIVCVPALTPVNEPSKFVKPPPSILYVYVSGPVAVATIAPSLLPKQEIGISS